MLSMAMAGDEAETAPIESVRRGDHVLKTVAGSEQAYPVWDNKREGNDRHGYLCALYSFPDSHEPFLKEREGTSVKVIRKST